MLLHILASHDFSQRQVLFTERFMIESTPAAVGKSDVMNDGQDGALRLPEKSIFKHDPILGKFCQGREVSLAV